MIKSSAQLPEPCSDFADVLDMSSYQSLPADWLVGITDVVGSTAEIAAGRYKDVNYVGASAIAALGNAWGDFDFPFVFRGDGAAFAIAADRRELATAVLQRVAAHSWERFQLKLRIGLVPLREIRSGGRDVKVAYYAASESVTYAMFSGGGLNWADRQIKAGKFGIPLCRHHSSPDLMGLTCGWTPIPSRRGEILTLLVEPWDHSKLELFEAVARRVLDVVEVVDRNSHPVPETAVLTSDVQDYLGSIRWSDVVANSDYRRFDDVLRLTLDCSVEQIEAVDALLTSARDRGEVHFGLHRQSHALMTCLVPLGAANSHLHFLDGLGGGYAKAAAMLEARNFEATSVPPSFDTSNLPISEFGRHLDAAAAPRTASKVHRNENDHDSSSCAHDLRK